MKKEWSDLMVSIFITAEKIISMSNSPHCDLRNVSTAREAQRFFCMTHRAHTLQLLQQLQQIFMGRCMQLYGLIFLCFEPRRGLRDRFFYNYASFLFLYCVPQLVSCASPCFFTILISQFCSIFKNGRSMQL